MSTPEPSELAEARDLDAQASVLMKQGIRLMNEHQADATLQALEYFGRALELRRRLPIDAVPFYRYTLAACLLNQADALTSLERPDQIEAALHAYDEAIAVLGVLTLGDDSRFPRRLAMAHQNRGLALVRQGRAADADESFARAIAVLEHADAQSIADRQYMLAVIWMNLAILRATGTTVDGLPAARLAALRAIELMAESQATDAEAAEVSLKARHVLCRTVAARLSSSSTSATMADDVHEATDLADEGLALVRQWESVGTTRFRGLAYDLFRFGARVYALYQPHFLDEFIDENMDPAHSSAAFVGSDEMQAAAREARAFGGDPGSSG